MGDKVSVQPESLLGASARFSAESQELASALGKLRNSLGSLGDVTGNDEQGQKFASVYDPNAAKLDQAMTNLSSGLADIGRALEVMAINYLGSDTTSQVRKNT